MSKMDKSQLPKHRKEAIEKLSISLSNPGRFSILVIGDQGTGKTHSIHELQNDLIDHDSCQGVVTIFSGLAEETFDYWNDLFKRSEKKILLIEEVDKLSQRNQDILFDCISTTNGLFGFKEKSVRCRLVFTSTFGIDKLRDDRRFLTAKFFDRISQLVVEMPNLKKDQRNILNDFKTTWVKMKFKDFGEIPDMGSGLGDWLVKQVDKMYGNFRDLDKIVINWHNYRLMKKKDDAILIYIKEDFEKFLHNPKQVMFSDNIFIFNEDDNYETLRDNFKRKLKIWAESLYGDKYNAAKKLVVSVRTLERWV